MRGGAGLHAERKSAAAGLSGRRAEASAGGRHPRGLALMDTAGAVTGPLESRQRPVVGKVRPWSGLCLGLPCGLR